MSNISKIRNFPIAETPNQNTSIIFLDVKSLFFVSESVKLESCLVLKFNFPLKTEKNFFHIVVHEIYMLNLQVEILHCPQLFFTPRQ